MILKNSLFLSFMSIFIFLNGSAQVVSKESVLEQGLNYIKVGKLKEAIGAFKQSIQSEGENPAAEGHLDPHIQAEAESRERDEARLGR